MEHLPTLRQLRYFAALVEHGHFGRAAEACFVSQSAFSVAIRELETLLSVQLVDRTHKKVTITATGRDIATQARLCLRDAEALLEMARHEQQPLTGRLNLGVIPTIAPFLLPRFMPALHKAYPRLQLFLREDTTARLVESLQTGELDLVLMALPYELRHVEVMTLLRDPFRLACHKGTNRVDPKHYSFNRLQKESVLLLQDGHCLRDHALAACRIRRTEKLSRFAASSLLTLVQMVDADLGVTYLPAMAEGSALLANTGVRTYPLDKTAYRDIGLVWRRGSARGEEFRTLGELIVKHRPRGTQAQIT
ncbi:MAG: hydrogen peroxide-inducible genes activator [Pseudomonadota bacterium]|nr:MAG: hydrogen peroxide-inducible genes activator [Pseudomonadota bacterium]